MYLSIVLSLCNEESKILDKIKIYLKMNNEILSFIRDWINNDKLSVTYHWSQRTFNLLPTETENLMKQFLNQSEGINT